MTLSTTITGPDTPGIPPVLIAHGLFGQGRNLGVIARQLAETRRVVSVDMRNHGASGRCRNVTGMSGRYTSDLLDALTHLRADGRVTGALGCLAMSFSTWEPWVSQFP